MCKFQSQSTERSGAQFNCICAVYLQLLVPPESLWSIPVNLMLLLQKVSPETELGMYAWGMNGATDYTVSLNT